ncbi:MAG: nucleotide exchange factor GrpE [Gammaproteobacteria bacterium]
MIENSQDEPTEAPSAEGGGIQPGEDEMAIRLSAAENEAAEERERALRLAAEMENVRRRSTRDIENARRYALERFAAELLPVADSLDLALGSAEAAPQSVREGLEMTLKLMHDIFARHHIEVIDPAVGDSFNPEYHEAMTTQPSDEIAPDHVLTVVQKGYRLHDRLLRAARVVVSRAAEEPGEGA